jgi:hypothetical protein
VHPNHVCICLLPKRSFFQICNVADTAIVRPASPTISTALLSDTLFAAFQWLVGTLQVIAGLGIVLLIVELSFKSAKQNGSWFTKRYFPILNVVLASEWWTFCFVHALLSSKHSCSCHASSLTCNIV